ncbi:hypothetical protein [Sphingobacterium sp. SYP-B4668]|uniref:hypothetical protein n=1 Tax=Sphingobacterium sp. SYP-B4668 TaxID=2996035 RepID=UPI0022DD3A72|nr:hypothetical protein [Sphingobacterium sp. SYP-B4668]
MNIGFTVFFTFILIGAIYWLANRHSRTVRINAEGDRVLSNPFVFAFFGASSAILCAFVLAMVFVSEPEEGDNIWVIATFIMLFAGLFGYISIYYLGLHFKHRVFINDARVKVINAWGVAAELNWSDITEARYDRFMHQIVLYGTGGGSIRISGMLYGLEEFRDELKKHHPHLVKHTVMKTFPPK